MNAIACGRVDRRQCTGERRHPPNQRLTTDPNSGPSASRRSRDTPSAFGSTFAEEADRSDAEWSDRAQWASAGVERITLLAHRGDRVVGIAGGYREEIQSTEVDLVSMWTAPEVRRRGLGRLLVGAVIDWAAETGAASVGLWVTRGNSPAQLLYESMGFRETGEYQAAAPRIRAPTRSACLHSPPSPVVPTRL